MNTPAGEKRINDRVARRAIRHDQVEGVTGLSREEFGLENLDLWRAYALDHRRQSWEEGADEDEGFYHGNQFTTDEIELLNARGQVTAAMNRVRPLLRQFVAELTANLPAFTVLGATSEDHRKSWIFQEYLAWAMYQCFFQRHAERVIKDMARVGVGSMIVDFDPRADDLRGDIVFRRGHRKEVFYDPDSQEWDFSDSENIVVSRVVSLRTAIGRWPKHREGLIRTSESWLQNAVDERNKNQYSQIEEQELITVGQEWTLGRNIYEQVSHIRLIERYTKVQVEVSTVVHQDGRQVEFLDPQKLERYLASQNRRKLEVVKITLPRIARITSAVDYYLDGEILPISDYPIVPFTGDDADNPFPIGEVRHLKDVQRLVNKWLAVLLYSAQVTSNLKILAEEGAIDKDEVDKFQTNYAVPGSISIVKQGAITGGRLKELAGQPINTAAYTILSMLLQHMEYEIGMFSMSAGNPEAAPRTAQATRDLKEFGGEKVALILRGVDQSYTRVGRVALEWMQAALKSEKVLRVVGDTDVAVDRQRMLQEEGVADATGMFAINQQPQQGDLQLDENRFLEITEDSKAVIRYINDVSVGKYDLRVVPASYRAVNRQAKLQEMMELQQRGIVDGRAVLDQVEIKDKERILKRMDVQQQLAAQLEGAVETVNNLETQLQRLQSKVTSEKIKTEVAKTTAELRVMLREFRSGLEQETRTVQGRSGGTRGPSTRTTPTAVASAT